MLPRGRKIGIRLRATLRLPHGEAGEPARVIGAYAGEVKADLVVVGHHKRNMVERWWSSPTSAYLCDHIGCTVIIARNAVSDQAFEKAMTEAVAPVEPA